MRLPVFVRIVVIMPLLVLFSACQQDVPNPIEAPRDQPLTRFEFNQIHMGMRTRLVVYATDETSAVNACRAAFARITQIDGVASDYQKNSELMRLCRSATTRPVPVSDDLWTLLSEAQKLSRVSDGNFDITVGPVVRLWRQAWRSGKLPSQDDIAQASRLVGWKKVELNAATRSVRLRPPPEYVHLAEVGEWMRAWFGWRFEFPSIRLDLGGIAKGYAGDCAIATLREHGIKSALFEAGGDIVLADAPPGKDGWHIELEGASPDMPKEVALHNCAISTSGDTEQFVEIGGKHYSHVVDPRTGIGVTTRKMGTVISPKGIWSDGLSKAVYLMLPEKLEGLLRNYPGAKAYVRVVNE